MKKTLSTVFILTSLLLILGCEVSQKGVETSTQNITAQTFPSESIPAIGSSYDFDGVKSIIVGGGALPFEFTSTKGESLTIYNLDMKAAISVVVPNVGDTIKIDPTIPSWKINGVDKTNEYAPKGTYLLLEYDRANN